MLNPLHTVQLFEAQDNYVAELREQLHKALVDAERYRYALKNNLCPEPHEIDYLRSLESIIANGHRR